MLKQKVRIKGPASDMYGMEGIIVAVNALLNEESREYDNGIVCKVLVGERLSDWMPHLWLEKIALTHGKTA